MKLIKTLFLVTLFCFSNTTFYAKELLEWGKDVFKGEVVVTVEYQTYTLPIYACYRAKNTFKGKPNMDYSVRTYKSRKSKETDPRFSAVGREHSEKSKIYYRLSIKSGVIKGGADYKGQISFKYLDGTTLHFAGDSKKRKMKLGELIKSVVPIEFTATCE